MLLAVWGLAWSVLAIAVIIPHFNPMHHYPYWNDGGVVGPGGHPSVSALAHQLVQAGHEKLWTTFLILLPVAFLALRSPLVLIALPSLALRFISTNPYFWGTGGTTTPRSCRSCSWPRWTPWPGSGQARSGGR